LEMDWSRQTKKTKPRVAKAVKATTTSPGLGFTRSRSNSFVLTKVFDETIERESKRKDTPTDFLLSDRDGDDIIELQDVEYGFGSEW